MSEKRQSKKSQFTEEKQGGAGKKIAIFAILAVVAAGAAFMLLGPSESVSGYNSVKSADGEVRIALDSVDNGEAHFFTYTSDRGEINFFVVKSVDGVMRAAFDACDVCYKSKQGYRQEGQFMVCNNCGQQFRTDLVNEVKGGCNPAPLHRRIEGKQLVISNDDLIKGAWYFGS